MNSCNAFSISSSWSWSWSKKKKRRRRKRKNRSRKMFHRLSSLSSYCLPPSLRCAIIILHASRFGCDRVTNEIRIASTVLTWVYSFEIHTEKERERERLGRAIDCFSSIRTSIGRSTQSFEGKKKYIYIYKFNDYLSLSLPLSLTLFIFLSYLTTGSD